MILFPISDESNGLKRVPWVTYLFIVLNIAVFIYQQMTPGFTEGHSAVPAEITGNQDLVGRIPFDVRGETVLIEHTPGPRPIYLTLLTAMFMHGSFMHIFSNLLFLYIFGDNVELRFGSFRFILFYLVSGIAASAVHILLDPNSVIPSLGASGAIAGVLGAYLVMFPWNRVNALLFFVKVISIPAWVVIGLWGVLQVLSMLSLSHGSGGGVAYGAHVGGLVAGIILGLATRLILPEEPDSILSRNYQMDEKARRILR